MRGAIDLDPGDTTFISFLRQREPISIESIYVWVWAQSRFSPFKHIHKLSVHDTIFEVWISVFHSIIIIVIDYLTILDLSQNLLTVLNRLMQSLSAIVKFVIPALFYTEKWIVKVDH